jgi:hypothetical protein
MMTYFSPFLRVCVLVVFALLVMLLNDDYGATFLVVHGEELGLEKKMTMVEKKKKALLLPTIPNVQSLRSGMHDDIVKRAFFGKNAPGVLFVKGLKGFQEVREKSLRRLAECATSTKKTKKEDEKEDVFLRNSKTYSKEHPEIERSTLAEFANKRLSMDVNGECEDEGEDGFDLRRELEKLRDFADVVSRATLPRLDAILNSNEKEDKTRRPSRMERNFFNDALRSEASLDHFHVYASSEDSSSSSSSEKNVRVNKSEKAQGKHEHTDVGVAIVMTPAWVNGKDDQAGSRGLIVDGVSFDIPSDGMLVLLGEAARAWHPKRHERVSTTNSLLDEIKIPTHAVALERGETRAWFGRMILPNLSDEHPDLNVNLNFGEWLNGARALVNGINGIEDVKETSGSSSDVIDYVSAACDGLRTTNRDRVFRKDEYWPTTARARKVPFTAGSAANRFQQGVTLPRLNVKSLARKKFGRTISAPTVRRRTATVVLQPVQPFQMKALVVSATRISLQQLCLWMGSRPERTQINRASRSSSSRGR